MNMYGALGTVVILGGLCLVVYFWTVCLFRWKGRRLKAIGYGFLTFLIAMIGGGFLVSQDPEFGREEREAKEAERLACNAKGFNDVETCKEAAGLGFETSAAFTKHKLAIAEEEREKLEKQRLAEEEAEAAEEAACRADLQCWGDKHQLEATFACEDFIPRLAKFQSEWTDGILEPKFSHFRWKDKNNGVVTHIGDKIKFQNGFGAWQLMVYECDYDPLNKAVLDVRAQAGRL